MKYFIKISVLTSIVFALLSLSSCKGSAGKKATNEAVEYIEKKGASLLEKEGSKAVEEESAAERYWKNADDAVEFLEELDYYEEEEDVYQYQSQAVSTVCRQCGGNGLVYMLDMYGNVMFDVYGNPQITTCPVCYGNGQVIVYQ